jgi:Nif-specific regulatory protein
VKPSLENSTFRLIYELACAFATRIELDDLIPLVIDKCREVLKAQGVSVLLLDPERNELYFPYVSQTDPDVAARLAGLRFPADRGVAGAALTTGQAQKIDRVESDPRFYAEIDRQTGVTTRSLLAVPLASPEGPLGVIEAVQLEDGAPFSDEDLGVLKALAGSIEVSIFNASRFGSLKASEQRLRLQVEALRRDLAERDCFSEIIGVSAAMNEVFRLMKGAAGSTIPVLIEGETGTGKELVARGIHRASARAEGPFIAINCGALPETLLESELFGHRRGSFTGAISDHPGLFRAASGGVIFLDEIGEMPLPMQAKLLRALQEGEVVALGDHRPHKVDVKVISATNRNLKAAVAEHHFREDLYYRLAAFPIRVPPLRERREDISLLAAHFLATATQRHHKRIRGFDPATVGVLCRLDWPGNVRELQNEIERAVVLAQDDETIRPGHLSSAIVTVDGPISAGSLAPSSNGFTERADRGLREARAAFETHFITQVLEKHHGNVSRAATALGISRIALQKKMKLYALR